MVVSSGASGISGKPAGALRGVDRYPYLVMKLLWRAVTETMRELGLNVPTVVKVVLGIGFPLIIAGIFPVPETGSVPSYVPWLIKFVAWLSSVVVAFVLILAWNAFKVARRERAVSQQLRMAAEEAKWKDDQMKMFLRNVLSNPSYGVAKCYAFGSVVRQYPTHDVDIVVQFDSSEQRQVRVYRERLRHIESSFQEFYGQMLHVQTFLFDENTSLHRFLNLAEAHECII